MITHPCALLVGYKQWADRGLYEVVASNFERLSEPDSSIALRLLDHMHVVDRIFLHHLQGIPHAFGAPRSRELPRLEQLTSDAMRVDDWYVSYVDALPAAEFEQTLEFAFTSGSPARMTRAQVLMHVCLHGTYHRGNVGLLLQKNGVTPNDDRVTDFLQRAA